MISLIISILLILYLITILIEYKEIEPMTKVLVNQSLNSLNIAIIYKTLETQIKINNSMMKNKLVPKEKVEEIKVVNKETKNTLKKIKVLAKEAGVEI